MANSDEPLRRMSIVLTCAAIILAIFWLVWIFTSGTRRPDSQALVSNPHQEPAGSSANVTMKRAMNARDDHMASAPPPTAARIGRATVRCRVYRHDQIPREYLGRENQLLAPEDTRSFSERLAPIYSSFEPTMSLQSGENTLLMDVGKTAHIANYPHVQLHVVFSGDHVRCDRLFVGLPALAENVDKGPLAEPVSLRSGCSVLTPLPPSAHVNGDSDTEDTPAGSSDRPSSTTQTTNCVSCHPRDKTVEIIEKMRSHQEWIAFITIEVPSPALDQVESPARDDVGF